MKIFIASFLFVALAEMGDKTQLATLALAAKYQSIVSIWMGTTAAMLAADTFGIIVGVVLGKRIPERFVKWFAAMIFILFGIIGLYDSIPKHFLTPLVMSIGIIVILGLVCLVVRLSRSEVMVKEKSTTEAALSPERKV